MCACTDVECKMHRERPCPMPSQVDGHKEPENPEMVTSEIRPFCVPCGAHALTRGWKMRARPGDNLGR